MRFQSVVVLGGKTATGIRVPPEVIESLGAGKRPAVSVTVGSHTYRTTVGSMDGEFMLPLSAENRGLAGVSAGDSVEVDIELDTAPREVDVPPDFAGVLDQEAEAKRFFESLSYSNKRRLVLAIEAAKTEETRRRRIEKTIAGLRDGQV